jgi:AAA domain
MKYEPIVKGVPQNHTPPPKVKQGLLRVRTANACINDAKNQPIPQSLCGNFWFEGEVSILFADTNVGKSILAVQSATNISGGYDSGIFGCNTPPQKVLYLDFELSDKQFEKRYSVEWQNHYLFDSNFLRIMINVDCTDFEDFEKQLFIEIEEIIEREQSKVLIIDNITYLRMQSTESGKEALPLMKHLVQLKNKFGLSILVLAHTPKRPNPVNPLTVNDLAGSRQLANFADSIFCIGKSVQGIDIRYIKQLKARSCGVQEEVLVCELGKPYNFLGFEFLNEDFEQNHLHNKNEADEKIKAIIIEMKAENKEVSLNTIAEKAGTNKMKIQRMIKRHNL